MTKLMIIALTIFGEAAGEPHAGKMAVASVIWNRANGNPERLTQVCKAPRQFSCWNAGAPRVPRDQPSQNAWAECADIASTMLDGSFEPTTEANHYFATWLKQRPSWAADMTELETIGRHVFFTNRKGTTK